MIAVNFAPSQTQCYVRLPEAVLGNHLAVGLDAPQEFVNLRELLSQAVYQREKAHLYSQGLYIDLPAWGSHIFEIEN